MNFFVRNENTPSWLAADGVFDSSGNKSKFAFAHYEVETNVPGPAYATVPIPLRIATAWHGGRPPRRSCARATKTGSTTIIHTTGTMILEKISNPVPACRDGELPS